MWTMYDKMVKDGTKCIFRICYFCLCFRMMVCIELQYWAFLDRGRDEIDDIDGWIDR